MSGLAPPIPYQWQVGDTGNAALLNAQLFNGLTFLLGPPLVSYQQSTAQSLASAGFTAVSWPTPVADTYGGYSASTPTRYTPQAPGWYLFIGSIGWAANATGGRTAAIYKNGTILSQQTLGNATATFNSVAQVCAFVYCNGTSDYVELYSNQSSGGALNSVPAFTTLWGVLFHI